MERRVSEQETGIRLDILVSRWLDESRAQIAHLIKAGDILVNGQVSKPAYKSEADDLIVIKEVAAQPSLLEPIDFPLDIIYEDDDLLVINKPSGLVVHPGAGKHHLTLVNALLAYTNQLSESTDNLRPGIVHRLDKMTSGLLVVAKHNKAHRFLAQQLKTRTMKRQYICLVDGVFPHQSATIDAPIGRDPKLRQKMAVVETNSKKAITHLLRLETFSANTLLQCNLESGRTHQIRVHLNYIGYPITNDPLYGKAIKGDDFEQYLHAQSIQFIHPKSHELMSFTCDLPQPFLNKLAALRSVYDNSTAGDTN